MPWVDERRMDDPDIIAALDSHGSLRALAGAGAQVRRGLVASEDAGIARVAGGERPRAVVVAALGGSAVVGDVLGVLAEAGSPVPVTVRHDAPLPGWVGPLDLVIAVSQSGRAAGPMALAVEAARRGASLLTVGAARSPLADLAAQARGIHVEVPLPAPSSRTALWSLLTPVLVAADVLGIADVPAAVLEQVADALDEIAEECRPASESFVNPAKLIAAGLDATVPMVLGDGPLSGVAACRMAQMLSLTARVPATHGVLPDAASTVVATLDGPFGSGMTDARSESRDIFSDPYLDGPEVPRLGLVALRDPGIDTAGRQLVEAVLSSAREAGAVVLERVGREGPPVVRMASLIGAGDFAATYLALGLGLDPSVSRHVSDLRDRTS